MSEDVVIPPREPINKSWVVVTFKKPLQWTRSDQEIWLFNPPLRYILNANQLDTLKPYIDTISDLKTGRLYRPLVAGAQLHNSRILVERYRDRGIGDLLFMTGPLAYLRHLSGASCHIDVYALADRSHVLAHHPTLAYDSPLVGPIQYDSLNHYHYHWFVEHATEHDEEVDQLNVYDALYRQLGVDPNTVPVKYKRPTMRLVDKDAQDLDSLYYVIYAQRKIDLRKTAYYVVAPVSNSNLRTAPYALWLQTIRELAKVRPVVVVGKMGPDSSLPTADMSFGKFYEAVQQMSNTTSVINLMGETSLRAIASLMQHAILAVTLDSGLLYVAEALRVPTISLWGTHAPAVRLGYDPAYMDLAIWPRENCGAAPCFAYANFPYKHCPRGMAQRTCEVLSAIPPEAIIEKVTAIENGKWMADTGFQKVDEPPTPAPDGSNVIVFKP